jgi:putative transposase
MELEVVYPWWCQLKRYFPDMLQESYCQPGFHLMPHRWLVERAFGWLGRWRRTSKD